MENKKLLVDALCKISDIYFQKGDIRNMVAYADKAGNIINDINYMEGILEIKLLRIKVYYVKHDYIKTRELSNELIKLCGEEYHLYKGRTLLILADVFSEMIEVDEHLNMLQHALKCFEKVNNLKGIFASLNNIAGVYADKLQDNISAMKHYLRLKRESEKENVEDFIVYSNFNIGEVLLKQLKFEEARTYLEESLQRSKEATMQRLAFYTYCNLIDVCIKLTDYACAFNYFELVKKELSTFPNQGPWLIHYYKVLSQLMLEVGFIEESKKHIKKAIDLSDNENSIIRWNNGFIYETIKIRETNNEADITDSIKAVHYIISNFKNPEAKLDKAYDYTIELIHKGYHKHALNFFNEYKHISCENEALQLRKLYIHALTLQDSCSEKIGILEEAINLAVAKENKKLLYNLYCYAFESYSVKDSNIGKLYYNLAIEIGRKLLNSIPEEYRACFKNNFLKAVDVN